MPPDVSTMLIRLLLALLLVSAQGVGTLHALEHSPAHPPGHVAKDGTHDADLAAAPEERCAACEALCSGALPPAADPPRAADAAHDRYTPVRDGPAPAVRHDGPGAARGPPAYA